MKTEKNHKLQDKKILENLIARFAIGSVITLRGEDELKSNFASKFAYTWDQVQKLATAKKIDKVVTTITATVSGEISSSPKEIINNFV